MENLNEMLDLQDQMVVEATKDNGFKDLKPAMGKSKALSTGLYLLKIKRLLLEDDKEISDIYGMCDNFIDVATEYSSKTCEEVNSLLAQIKQHCDFICSEKENKKLSLTQVNSMLDVPTMQAITLDNMFYEIDSSYKVISKKVVPQIDKLTAERCAIVFSACEARRAEIDLTVNTELSRPVKSIKSVISHMIKKSRW